jgi:RHS repeat-associated protein
METRHDGTSTDQSQQRVTSRPTSPSASAPSNESFQVTPPSITLPKGGGAIRGIGEKFGVNPVTGTGSLTIPIYTSPGRAGFGPQLSLSYDSGAGNGPFGFGWSLSLPSITRKTDKGLPRYDDAADSDVFILSGAEDLVPVLVKQGTQWKPETVPPRKVGKETYDIRRYRPRIEGLFARIERWTNQKNDFDVCWRSISKDNITTWYGKTAESRIQDPADPSRIFSWLICESYDDKGNAIRYHYVPEDDQRIDLALASERNRSSAIRKANRYLKRIQYANKTPRTIDEDLSKRSDWLLETVFDYDEAHYEDVPLGPATHAADQHEFVLASIAPGRTWLVRPDSFSVYRAGFEVRTYRRCRRVLMFHRFKELGKEPYLVKATEFEYADLDYTKPFTLESELSHKGSTRTASFIRSVRQSGYEADSTPVVTQKNKYLKKSLPEVEFDYTQALIDETVHEVDTKSLENLPYGIDGSNYQWLDLDGEGLSGVLTEQAGAWFYKRNLSPGRRDVRNIQEQSEPKFGSVEVVATKPALALASGQAQFLDLAGDGQLDLAAFAGPTPGFYERTFHESWESFRAFTSLPNVAWSDPNLKFIDLTGDGHADILITEHEAFVWHPSLAEQGFAKSERVAKWLDEEQGPALVFADSTQSIYVADLSGDGLTDIVRIRNGQVCYWPNLGYGRFGAKVTMDNAPWFDAPDEFEQRRIRLADIDGSGVTDIIYLGRDHVSLYFNQSGNRWSDGRVLTQFPRIDNLASIQVADLLGNGTACLIWCSTLASDARRPMRYVGLMKEGKPHLLTTTKNNLGAETRVQYAPSTKFYVEDRLAGTPWATKLPFPVHVVERTVIYDHISQNCFVSRYSYHHGYFDGVEREFRGFGMVEQRDTEEIGRASAIPPSVPDTNWDAASFVPPVVTKTWFHTGAYLEQEGLDAYFKEVEYYQGDPMAVFLPDTVLPNNLSVQEEREACRALKGMMLRQEVYADDAPPGSSAAIIQRSQVPYTVLEQSYTIELVQPAGPNLHAVFFSHAREALTYHYERNPTDPRVQHALTLEVDSYGNVLKEAVVGYGRRRADPNLSVQDQNKQSQLLITYSEHVLTNAIDAADDYRAPLPCESRTYELTGVGVAAGRHVFLLNDVLVAGRGAIPIPYEQRPTAGLQEKRLIEQVRTLYRPNDLGQSANNVDALLRWGRLESLALTGETYKLAFTPGLLADVYGRGATSFIPIPKDLLGAIGPDKGGYVDLYGDGHWWVPLGRTFYHQTSGVRPQTELAEATSHFFVPRRFRDPFHNQSVVTYDGYDLLVSKTRDAVGNTVTVKNDYRVLQPSLITDPNDNQSEVMFDALGLVVATAVMGKTTESLGDSLATITRDDANPTLTELQGFVAAPRTEAPKRLKTASTRIMYDLDRFRRTRQTNPNDSTKWQPVFASTLARETHATTPLPPQGLKIQISFSYSDGFGRQVQTKVQAEKGDAYLRNGPVSLPRGDMAPGTLRMQNGQPQVGSIQIRWVGTGRTVYNNKGKPVKQYEPFFSSTHLCETEPEVTMTGVTPVLFYDPVERVIATIHPNHTYEKVVFDPWKQTTYDVNDTVAQTPQNAQIGDPRSDSDIQGYVKNHLAALPAAWQSWYQQRQQVGTSQWEQEAAAKAAAHANTPTAAYLDALGRTFLTIAHNGQDANGNDVLYRTSVLLDIEGNQREVRDAKLDPNTGLGRIVMQYDYDLLSTVIHQKSLEAPEQWMLPDVMGKPIRVWKSPPRLNTDPAQLIETHYDALRRPTESFVEAFDPADFARRILYQRLIYGDDPNNGLLPKKQIDANLRGKLYRQFDGAGMVTNILYDFKGNLVDGSRRLTVEYQQVVDWLTPPNWAETFTSQTQYDALNRPISMVSPHTGAIANVTQPIYNEAGLLNGIDVSINGAPSISYVKNIDYNEKGQRTQIECGNGAVTTYGYDPLTFRLTNITTTRPARGLTQWKALLNKPTVVQDLQYTYDPAGNITHVIDRAHKSVVYNSQQVDPESRYTYDAVYRLIAAQGREHIGQMVFDHRPPDGLGRDCPFLGIRTQMSDLQAIETYRERYEYDEVGNIAVMRHSATNNPWTRGYDYREHSLIEPGRDGNRLSRTSLPGDNLANPQLYSATYTHDDHGCITRMHHLQAINWDFKDQLQHIRQGTMQAYYVYDGAGQRIRKRVEKNNGALVEERIYLGGFEIFRRSDANGPILDRETMHVMDDKQRVALIETRMRGNEQGVPKQLIRYQFTNHLGSACLELDEQTDLISYEEYHPYGTSSYQLGRSGVEVSLKRYRYTGKERDEESGFSYHGARYYATSLGRWVSCDPSGLIDGPNLYQYTRNSPTMGTDKHGHSTDLLYKNKSDGKKAADAAVDVAKLEKGVIDAFQEVVVQAGKGGSRIDQILQKLSQGVPDLVAEEIKRLDASKYVKNGVVDASKLAARVEGIFKQVYKHNFAFVMEDFLNPATGEPIVERLKIFFSGTESQIKAAQKEVRSIWKILEEKHGLKIDLKAGTVTDLLKKAGDYSKKLVRAGSGMSSNGAAVLDVIANDAVEFSKRGLKMAKETKLGKFAGGAIELGLKKGGKIIPVVGTGVGIGLAVNEFRKGNYAAAFVEAAGASEIPIVAQVADIGSLASDLMWIAKDTFDPEQKIEQWWYENVIK